MKKVLKFLEKFLLWFIACFMLSFVIMVIAIAINGGRPVSGANCSLLSVIVGWCVIFHRTVGCYNTNGVAYTASSISSRPHKH